MFNTKSFNKTITLEQERDIQMSKPLHFAGLICQGEQQPQLVRQQEQLRSSKTVEQLIRQQEQEQQLNKTIIMKQEDQLKTQHTTYYPTWFNGQQKIKHQELNGEDVVITGVAGKLNKAKQQLFNMQQLQQLECMERKVRTLIKVTHEAILDCGMCPTEFKGKCTGVFVGASSNTVQQSGKIAQHVSKFFEFMGPAVVHQTPCTSSLIALDSAITALKIGECEQAIVADFHPLSTIGVVVLQLKPTFTGKFYASIVHSKNMTPEQRLFKGEPIYPVGEMHTRVLRQMYTANGIDASIVNTIEKQFNQELITSVFVPAIVRNTVPVFVGQRELNQEQTGLYTIIKMMKQIQQGCVPANLYYQSPSYKVATLLAAHGKTVEQNNTKFFGGLMALNAFGPRGDSVHILMTPNKKYILTHELQEKITVEQYTQIPNKQQYRQQEQHFAASIRQGEQQPQLVGQQEQLIRQGELKMTVEQYRQCQQQPQLVRQQEQLIRQGELKMTVEQYRQCQQQPQLFGQQEQLIRQGELKMTVEQYRQCQQQPQLVEQQEQLLRKFILEQIKFYQRQQEKKQQKETIVQLINQKLQQQFPETIFGQNQEQQYIVEQLIKQLIKQEQVKETLLMENVLPRSHSVECFKRQSQLNTPYTQTEETPLCKLVKKIISGKQQFRAEHTLQQCNVDFKILDKVQKVLEQQYNMNLTLREVNQLTIQQLSTIEQQKLQKFEKRSFLEEQRGEQVARLMNQIYRNL